MYNSEVEVRREHQSGASKAPHITVWPCIGKYRLGLLVHLLGENDFNIDMGLLYATSAQAVGCVFRPGSKSHIEKNKMIGCFTRMATIKILISLNYVKQVLT